MSLWTILDLLTFLFTDDIDELLFNLKVIIWMKKDKSKDEKSKKSKDSKKKDADSKSNKSASKSKGK